MSDHRRPISILRIRGLTRGIHDLPGFETSDFRSFAVRLGPHESRPTIDRSAETLLLVAHGTLTVIWVDAHRAATELGEGDTALTNPPAVEALLAGADGAAYLALVNRVGEVQ
jgi:hypothetical protein